MKRLVQLFSISAGLLLVSNLAHAQYYPGQREGRYDRDRDDRYDRDGYGRNGRGYGNPIAQVLADLSRLDRFADRDANYHVDKAQYALHRFEVNSNRGRFDKDRLDEAIEHVEHLARRSRLDGRGREIAFRDLELLRNLRSTGGYGYNNGGYREHRGYGYRPY